MLTTSGGSCLVCARPIKRHRFDREGEVRGLCRHCTQSLAWPEGRRCERCDKPLAVFADSDGSRLCSDCLLWHGVYFEKNYSAVVYQGAIKDLLYDYKYRGRRSVVYTLFDLLRRIYARERLLQQTDGMTYVPLHAGRLQERGFNQAEELARMLAKWANKPLLHGLIRQTATGKLSKMGRWERLASMQGAFHAGKRTAFTRWTWLGREMTVFSDHAIWKGRRILLIDDVYTTGGTVNDCARELLATGASSVRVLTIARAV